MASSRVGGSKHQLDDLLHPWIVGRAHLLDGGFDVVLRTAKLDVRPEERPVGPTPFAFVRQTHTAGAQQPNPLDLSVVADMDVGGHHDALVYARHELAYPFSRRSLGNALLVRARRAVAKADGAEAVDLDGDGRLEAGEECEVLLRVQRGDPRPALALGVSHDGPIRIAANEPCRDAKCSDELERLARERAPREIAAEDDQIGLGALDLCQHRLQRGRVTVDVREHGHASSRTLLVALSH
jgi:hypothetical protein